MKQKKPTHLLLIEHDLELAKKLIEQLTITDIHYLHISHVSNVDDAFRELKSSIKHLIIIDIDNGNISKLKNLHKHYDEMPIIALTSTLNTTTEIEIIKNGAQDCLSKMHLTSYDLKRSIYHALEQNKLAIALKAEKQKTSKLIEAIQSGEIKKGTKLKNLKIKHLLKGGQLTQSTQMLLLKAKQQKQAEALLSDLQRRYALILESAGEGIYGLDAEGRVMFINPAAERLLGWEPGKLIGKLLHQVAHYAREDGTPYLLEECPLHSVNEQYKIQQGSDEIFWRKDKTCFPIEYTSTPIIENSHLVGTVVNFRDITERKQTEKQMTQLAMHDNLTSLANRLQFEKALKNALAVAEQEQRKMALLFVDLDEFKRVNDDLGHDVGDRLLQEVAKRLFSCIRQTDFVARLGGDEFAIILPYIEENAEAAVVAQKIIEHINTPFKLGNYKVRVSTSIGIACYPLAAQTTADILKAADIAMYHAKDLGKNNYQYFSKEVRAQNLYRNKIENALKTAVEKKEFLIMYQPIFHLKTRKITGLEALLRWKNSELGKIDPNSFIPIAEETGILVPIGRWIIEESCKQFSIWQKEFKKNYKLAINLSPKQLIKHNLIDRLTGVLNHYDISPKNIEIEITESAVMSKYEAEENLKKLHQLGIAIAIDDFGTGYSSLSRLRYLPINCLKIDKSFIEALNQNKNDAIIVKSILALGKSLRLNVIAEGIESDDQLNFLIKHHCNEGQGHLFSLPLTAEETTRFLKNRESSSSF